MTLPEHTRQPLGPNQERWLKALESGEYAQGKHVLRSMDDKFCCLGVACEIADLHGKPDGESWFYNGCDGFAPEELVQFLALYSSDGDSMSRTPGTCLVSLNDFGHRFSEIAAIIRSDPSVYFKEPR